MASNIQLSVQIIQWFRYWYIRSNLVLFVKIYSSVHDSSPADNTPVLPSKHLKFKPSVLQAEKYVFIDMNQMNHSALFDTKTFKTSLSF